MTMRGHRFIIFLIVCLIACLFVLQGRGYALDPHKKFSQYIHDSWGEADGLPKALITHIIQGEKGYLWMATTMGIVRFDCYRCL